MRGITEKRLKEIQSSITDGTSKLFMKLLINECKEIDTLTVSKLRPMSDAEPGESVLVKFNGSNVFHAAYIQSDCMLNIYGDMYGFDLFTGFIPIPKYKPE